MRRRAVWWLLAGVVIAGILFLFVLPGRTWLAQRRSMSVAEQRMSALSKANADLGRQIKDLHDPAYLEQLARREFGYVMRGEKVYAIDPPSRSTAVPTTTTTTVPTP